MTEFRKPVRTSLCVSKLDVEDENPLMTTTYSLYQRPMDNSEADEPPGNVEVPSWRILPVTGQSISRRENEEVGAPGLLMLFLRYQGSEIQCDRDHHHISPLVSVELTVSLE